MKLHTIPEPEMEFGNGTDICPRSGISQHAVYDSRISERRESVLVGAVGTSEVLDKLHRWLGRCEAMIPAKKNNRQPTLYPAFCGLNSGLGFKVTLKTGDNLTRQIHNSDMQEVLDIDDSQWNRRIEVAVELYYEKIKFLAQNRPMVDVIVCVMPNELFEKISQKKPTGEEGLEPTWEEDAEDAKETNFRRALKARSMHLGKPLQLIRESGLETNPKGQQDDATRAWNFCTALYYKANKTVPWRLIPNDNRPKACFVGIGFYRSRDYQVLNTSLAQVFDELGNGVILRGTAVDIDKEDRRPYMTEEQAYLLLKRALHEYDVALETSPARLVIHKSSKFHAEEMRGFKQAMKELRVRSWDFVTILESQIRALRDGAYPPLRGTHIEVMRDRHLLYTRGSVPFYRTYPGHYPPQPLDVRIVESDESPGVICSEILGLTKMNWNNTQFDGKYPITLHCARKVGDIMKYLGPNDAEPQINYSFYM